MDSTICIKGLAEIRKQQVINKKVYDRKFMDDAVRKLAWKHLEENMVVDSDVLIDKKIGEVVDPEVNYTCKCYILSLYRP